MKRVGVPVSLVFAVSLVVSGCGGGRHTEAAVPTGPAAGDGAVGVHLFTQVHSDVLVNGAGYALYLFVPDRRAAVTCTSLCAASWPPLFGPAHGRVRAGVGVRAPLLGSDRDPTSGRPVVTYDGWPLYRYAGDPQPGYASGQGVNLNGGYWYLIRPDGQPVVPAGYPAPVPTP